MNYITAKFPLNKNSAEGDYNSINNVVLLIRQNLKNLILTTPGERIMDPNFGVGIKRFLFENKTLTTTQNIKSLIIGQAKKYIPSIFIQDVKFIDREDEPNYLGITILYTITPKKLDDSITLTFDTNSKQVITQIQRENILKGF